MRNAPDAWDGAQASRNTWSTRCRIPLLRCHRERRSTSKPQSTTAASPDPGRLAACHRDIAPLLHVHSASL
jgi:hypothetical protein